MLISLGYIYLIHIYIWIKRQQTNFVITVEIAAVNTLNIPFVGFPYIFSSCFFFVVCFPQTELSALRVHWDSFCVSVAPECAYFSPCCLGCMKKVRQVLYISLPVSGISSSLVSIWVYVCVR